MIKLGTSGAWLLNGKEVIEDGSEALAEIKAKTGHEVSKAEAAKETIAYSILEKHNTSDNMDKLKLRFDKLTSHDITFVGIIQTARASGLEKFPMPYVLTNCHNSLCAVGGTIMRMTTCSDSAVRRSTAECMFRLIRLSSISLLERDWRSAAR